MKKLWIKEVDKCMDCADWDYPENRDFCKKKRRMIPDDAYEIPSWCPLPDAEKKSKLRLFNRRNK